MASLQDAAPVKDAVTEAEAAGKEPQLAAPPPPPPPLLPAEDPVLKLDVEDEDGVEDLEAPLYDPKVDSFDEEDEEEKDLEYSSPLVDREDAAAPLRWRVGEAADFGDFEDDDEDAAELEDDE